MTTWTAPRLDGCVALVTGATRGVGKGVAVVLGEAGATVYVSGRTTVDDVAEEVTARGGRGVPARTDHANDAEVEALFERIERESGRLDLVVGNAWGGYADHEWQTFAAPLWEQPLSRWQTMFESGLRNQLTTARFAAGRMVKQGSGLIVFTGGWDDPGEYLGNLYYDVSKAAVTRLVAGLGHELRDSDPTVVGVVPGFTRTEAVVEAFAADGDGSARDRTLAGVRRPRDRPRRCRPGRAVVERDEPADGDARRALRLHGRRRSRVRAVPHLGRESARLGGFGETQAERPSAKPS